MVVVSSYIVFQHGHEVICDCNMLYNTDLGCCYNTGSVIECYNCSIQLHCVPSVLHLYKVIGNGIIPGNKTVLHESLFDVFIDNKYLTGMLNITQSINQCIKSTYIYNRILDISAFRYYIIFASQVF